MQGINKQAFADAKKKLSNIKDIVLKPLMAELSERLYDHAIDNAEYQNLTGNTITSYLVGQYWDGYYIGEAGFEMGMPLYYKLKKGDRFIDSETFDGNIVESFVAEVDTDGGIGPQTSWDFVKSYRSRYDHFLVMATGTEYSEFLEATKNLNVLTETYNNTRSIFYSVVPNHKLNI